MNSARKASSRALKKQTEKKFPFEIKSKEQMDFVNAIKKYDVVFGIGPAGTGKTFIAVAMAAYYLSNKFVDKIVICRPTVTTGEEIGFLPGDMKQKIDPFLRPVYDCLSIIFEDFAIVDRLVESKVLEVLPIGFMRGVTLTNSFVILDEGQNTTEMQMKTILTRLGLGSKIVVTGDPTQCDLPKGVSNGLTRYTDIFWGQEDQGIKLFDFKKAPTQRHHVVDNILKLSDNYYNIESKDDMFEEDFFNNPPSFLK